MTTPRLTSYDPFKNKLLRQSLIVSPISPIMKFIYSFLCFAAVLKTVLPAPQGFRFPDERKEKKLEPVITPPVLPVLEHLERDPSTLLPNETNGRSSGRVNPRFGFGGGFNVAPSGSGGLTASVSGSASGGGTSQSASQSFSFGFNEGFSASHSASQSASFGGFGNGFNGFSGSQASSQAASFGGSPNSLTGSAASSSAFSGNTGSQSASSAFGFNSLNGFPRPHSNFGEGLLDIRHRGVPNFPFPNLLGRSSGVGAAAFKKNNLAQKSDDDFFAILVSS